MQINLTPKRHTAAAHIFLIIHFNLINFLFKHLLLNALELDRQTRTHR